MEYKCNWQQKFLGQWSIILAFACLFVFQPRALLAQGVPQYDVTQQCFAASDEKIVSGTTKGPQDTLVRLNRTNGQTAIIGPTGTNNVEAIAFGPNSTLYAANGGQLGTLDLTTGAFTAKPQPMGTAAGSLGNVTISDADGLFFDITRNTLYATERRAGSDLLFKIDPATGAHVLNAFGPGVGYVVVADVIDNNGKVLSDVDDIAVDPESGQMYAGMNSGGTSGVLVIINPATGATAKVADFRYPNPYPANPALAGQIVDDIEGLSFFNDGQLYGSTGDNGPDINDKNKLFRIDKVTGATVLVGPFPSGQVDYEGLACLTAPAFITLSKFTNGPGQAPQDANTPTGPEIPVGAQVTWTYIFTNTGVLTLTDLILNDNQIGVIGPNGASNCPPASTILGPGDSFTCTATGTAKAGQYANTGIVTGTTQIGIVTPRRTVTATDPSHYFGNGPAVAIKKYTNGDDADQPTGPLIAVGSPVTWTYIITNTGNVILNPVTVTDNMGVVVDCLKTTLQPQESMFCRGFGTATEGQYANIGTVTGIPPSGPPVTDTDPSHYFGVSAAIVIKKYTNGEDADTPTGPQIQVGGAVTWTYIVTNTGNVTLNNVTVTDDKGVAVTCPKNLLEPGETMTCSATGRAVEGQYANIGTVIGTPPVGPNVTDNDPSHYFGYIPASLGNRVFGDINPNGSTPSEIANGNGIQDQTESGIDGIIVQLYRADGAFVAETVTANGGFYSFTGLPPGDYYLVFINPLGEGIFTTPNLPGANDEIDSDPGIVVADPQGRPAQQTEVINLQSGENDLSWDAGLIGLSGTGSAALGDRVWFDTDRDGIQDAGEQGFAGVTVRLLDANGQKLQETVTDQNGIYGFSALDPGVYFIEFVPPSNLTISQPNQGSNDEIDSDIDPISHRTPAITLAPFQTDPTWDAGIFQAGTGLDPEAEQQISKIFLPAMSR